MSLALILLGFVSIVELLLWLPLLWRVRKVLVCGLIPIMAVLSGLIFGSKPEIWTGLLLILSVYRVINLLRVLENRLHAEQLYRVSRRTGCWLVASQVLIVVASSLIDRQAYSALALWYALATVQLVVALLLFVSTNRHLRTTQPPVVAKHLSDHDLPPLTVAIPARNETDDLEACLQSLVSSDYPKLEILVLDDCSQNKHTPEIIRDYAHTGVRFIAGETPPQSWLAKNYAYHQLAESSNGELLLFCGVDSRFQPGTLRAMVEVILTKKKQMISFIPANKHPGRWNLESLLVQPARYAWELSPPRRLLNRPPVLSTCWLIEATALRAAGGFAAASHSISPESYLARRAISNGDGYSFMQSNLIIGLSSLKSPREQRATAIRVRYPQLHRRPELVAWSIIAEVTVLSLPFVLLGASLLAREWRLVMLAGITSILLTAFYVRVVTLTYRKFLVRGLWTLPFVAIYDIGLLSYSMWQYEFREVLWKGRNVCLPVMRRPRDPTANHS
jgi:glycosyltransferase involved in cell wall biosynthesis